MSLNRAQTTTGVFTVLLLVLAAVGYFVSIQARDAILDSRAGSVSEFSLDPSAPGFRAFTEPTPVALVLHTGVTGGGADLIGASVLSVADGGEGGAVVTLPSTFKSSPDAIPIGETFRTRGLDAIVDELGAGLRVGFGTVVVLDGSAWTSLMRADLPLTMTIETDLIDPEDRSVLVAAGTRPFNLVDVARISTHRNEGEPPLGVALRQQEIWRSWISRTAGTADRPDLFELDTGFSAIIGALASGEVSYRVIPTETDAESAVEPEATSYVAVDDEVRDLLATIVPFPEEAVPGDRPTVMLLDATLGDIDRLGVSQSVARAGGRVVILGNTNGAPQDRTQVQVHSDAGEAVAAQIARELGVDAPELVPLVDATAAITVIVAAEG